MQMDYTKYDVKVFLMEKVLFQYVQHVTMFRRWKEASMVTSWQPLGVPVGHPRPSQYAPAFEFHGLRAPKGSMRECPRCRASARSEEDGTTNSPALAILSHSSWL